jgi:hypothetical protein
MTQVLDHADVLAIAMDAARNCASNFSLNLTPQQAAVAVVDAYVLAEKRLQKAAEEASTSGE